MPLWRRMLKYTFIDWVLRPLACAIFVTVGGVIYHLATPALVYYHVVHVFIPRWRRLSFSRRLLESANVICFAPLFLPTRIWAYFNPPPCRHNSCIVRRYLTPKPPRVPWYTYLTPFYPPMERLYRSLRPRRPVEQNLDASKFLRLPVEIRNLIYAYASDPRHDVRYQDPWRVKPLAYHRTLNGLDIGNDYALSVEQDMICYHNPHNWEDAISYQLNDNGILAIHGAHRPPKNLLLVCQQVHNEACEQFLSTSAFEVQPLTPNHKSWNPDWNRITGSQSTYGALAQSELAPLMRKVRVRIDMSRFRQRRQAVAAEWLSPDNEFTWCKFDETCLEKCTNTVAARARELCEVLRTRVEGLRVVEIHWIDDYPDDVGESELEMRARVLLPFTELEGVQIRVRKLVMSEVGRIKVQSMLNQTLRST